MAAATQEIIDLDMEPTERAVAQPESSMDPSQKETVEHLKWVEQMIATMPQSQNMSAYRVQLEAE